MRSDMLHERAFWWQTRCFAARALVLESLRIRSRLARCSASCKTAARDEKAKEGLQNGRS